MATPDPKALHDTATALAEQAKAARQATLENYRSNATEHRAAIDEATVKLNTAKGEVKAREDVLAARQKAADDARTSAANNEKQAADAEKAGDSAKAAELREDANVYRASAESSDQNAQQAQQELSDARLAVAERQHELDSANQTWENMRQQYGKSEEQLDNIENKAKLLDEASRKLTLATATDNPVDRADAELAAEKLIKDANAIQIDTGPITTMTGTDVQLPDTTTLPTADTTPTAGPDATSDATPTGATDPGATGDGGTAAAATDDAAAGGAAAGGAGDTPGPGRLQDDFATVAAGNGSGNGTGDGAGAAGTPAAGDDRAGYSAQSEEGTELGGPVTISPTDDPLGTAPDPVAAADPLGTADPLGADGGVAAPAAGDTGTGFDAPSDTPSDAGADQPVAAADPIADPMPDASAAPADTFDDFSAAPADDTPVSVSDDGDS